MGLIRTTLSLAIIGALVWLGATVELGNHTFFGHVQRIWKSDETQDLVDGVGDKGKPMLDKVRRGIEAGVDEANKPDGKPPSDGG